MRKALLLVKASPTTSLLGSALRSLNSLTERRTMDRDEMLREIWDDLRQLSAKVGMHCGHLPGDRRSYQDIQKESLKSESGAHSTPQSLEAECLTLLELLKPVSAFLSYRVFPPEHE